MKPLVPILLTALALLYACPVEPARGQSSRVRVVMVLDTHGRNLGSAPQWYGQALASMLREGFRDHAQSLVFERTFSGSEATPAHIIDYFRRAPAATNETLVFYYFGHGATDSRTGEHYFAMQHGDLFRRELRAAMLAKNPRLGVILTDCCSSIAPARRLPSLGNFNILPAAPNWGVLSHLLLYNAGFVDLTAASPGQIALGGLFTNSLISLASYEVRQMDSNQDGWLAWSEYFAFVRSATNANFQKVKQFSIPAVQRQPSQVPRSFERQTVRRPESLGSRHLVTILENPFNSPLVYQVRWGPHLPWTNAQLPAQSATAYFTQAWKGGVNPRLQIQFDCIMGDNVATPRIYQLQSDWSEVSNQGRRYRFGVSGPNQIDLYSAE